jgi:predicted nucleic acid-binding protein
MRSGDARLLKTRRYTFDTGPLFLYFGEDLRVKLLLDEVHNGKAEGSTCEPNLAELYYKTCEKLGKDSARIRYFSIRRTGLSVLAPNENLSRAAGELKCQHRGKLSLVDAYILAVAIEEGATLVTSDPLIPEMKLVPTRLIEPAPISQT